MKIKESDRERVPYEVMVNEFESINQVRFLSQRMQSFCKLFAQVYGW